MDPTLSFLVCWVSCSNRFEKYGNKRNWKAEDFLQFEEILHDPLNVIS